MWAPPGQRRCWHSLNPRDRPGYDAGMLPDGFEWRPHIDDVPALYFAGRLVALTEPLDTGRVRVTLNPGLAERRITFLPGELEAIRYVEAWARKWEARLRSEHGAG